MNTNIQLRANCGDYSATTQESDALSRRELPRTRVFGFIRAMTGPVQGLRHPIQDRFVIGRSEDADLFLLDGGVSRRHAQLVPEQNGRVVLVDMDSANGVYVEGERSSCHVLSPGDRFSIGSSSFVFESSIPDRTATTPTPPSPPGLLADIIEYRKLRLQKMRGTSLGTAARLRFTLLETRLSPAPHTTHTLRRFRRFACRLAVTLRDPSGGRVDATVLDISAEGARLDLADPSLEVGQWIQIVLSSGDNSTSIALGACIRWNDGHNIGVMFAGGPRVAPAQSPARHDTVDMSVVDLQAAIAATRSRFFA
ncbi:MAG: FHA domain-containing protein [Deltaproteobacteria bacterium]|nr:FHA domain-containing protein [Deltaproteobacteria bacterium]